MSVMTDLRKSVTENSAVHAMVGVTDLAVEKAREAQQRATKARAELEQRASKMRTEVDLTNLPETIQLKTQGARARAQQLPTEALTKALEAAGRAEEAYDDLSARGKKLIDRIANQASTKELLDQGKSTISRGKAFVTTARRGRADTRAAAKAAVTTARRELAEVVDEAQQTVVTGTTDTKRAVKRTSTTAKTRAARTRSTAKATATSARKTAAAARKATEAAAEKVGD